MSEKDYYAITLFDNEGNLEHIWINVYLQIKSPPKISRNVTVNINNRWKVKAMVDTGATMSGISSRMAARMGLKSYEEQEFIHPKGVGKSPVYIFDVIFPKDKVFENIKAVEITPVHDCDFLIGMNVISMGDMAITRVDGKMAFSFRVPPAERYIDFESE